MNDVNITEPLSRGKILEVKGLETTFRTERGLLKAIENVSFDVYRGEMLGVVGESGCGKSVTSHSILRLYDEKHAVRYKGKILFDGTDLLSLPAAKMQDIRGQAIAMVFQDALSSLNPVMKVGDQIMEPLRIHQKLNKRDARKRALEMLRLVGIPDPAKRIDSFPHQLSGGMRQRVMIATALACNPRLLIADEPTTALDVTIQAQIMDLLVELNQKLGMGVILITHDLAVVAETCSRVVVMYLGQIVEEGSVTEIFEHPGHPYTQGLIQSIPQMEGDIPNRLYMIPGMVPLLHQIPRGCRFAPRCPFAWELCCARMPKLTDIGGTQRVCCWKAAEPYEKDSPALEEKDGSVYGKACS